MFDLFDDSIQRLYILLVESRIISVGIAYQPLSKVFNLRRRCAIVPLGFTL